jgi:RIO-like serine/threonine protein kinase
MASMSTEIAVLRALLRLSRKASPATLEDLVTRVREDAREVQHALASLARAQLVQRAGETTRLTMAGLAVALASSAAVTTGVKAPRCISSSRASVSGGRVLPLESRVRRGRAA